MNKRDRIGLIVLLFFILIVFLYHFFGYLGHFGYDDMNYAHLAYNFIHGEIDYNNHFTFRFPIILLTALSYHIFGVSDFASALPPLLITISILLLVFFTLKNKSVTILITAMSLTTFSNWFLFYSDKIMPDIYVAFSVMLMIFIIHKYKFESDKKQTILYSVFFSLSLFAGINSKESFILVIPLLGYYLITDILKKRDIKFWIYSIISSIFILSLYFFITWILTGNFAKRFEAIFNSSYLNLCSYDKESFVILFKRITYGFLTLLISSEMVTGFIFVLPFLIRKDVKKFIIYSDSFSFYMLSAVILLLSSNFMSISLSSYIPLCLDQRHYLFLIPVVSITAANIINEFYIDKKLNIKIIITLLIVDLFSVFIQLQTLWELYLPLTILFIAIYFFPLKGKSNLVYITAFILILSIAPFKMIEYAHKVNYNKQKEIVKKYIIEKNEDCYIITDYVQKCFGNYFGSFNNNLKCKFLSFNDCNIDTMVNYKKVVLLNWYSQYLSGLNENDLPVYIKYLDTSENVLYKNKALNIAIYSIDKGKPLNNSSVTEVLSSFNGFENNVPNWEQNNENITKTKKYDGNNSYLAGEYSATFVYNLDSVTLSKFKSVIISGSLYCNFEDETKAQLVISLESNATAYLWQSLDINQYIKAYSNWWPVKKEIIVRTSAIKRNSKLKVYVWNPDKKKAYIDNFSVTVNGLK